MKADQPPTYSQSSHSPNTLVFDTNVIGNNRDTQPLKYLPYQKSTDTFALSPNSSVVSHNKFIVDSICQKIIQLIYDESLPKVSYSKILSKSLAYHYTYLSNLFTNTKGSTIQQFVIYHKIERVKKLLVTNQISLTEIAYTLNYSSVAHLSNQFKKVTGLTPSEYKLKTCKK